MSIFNDFPVMPEEETQAPVNSTSVPHSREAEEATVGAIFINPDLFAEISQFLPHDDFYIHRHKYIWQAFTTLHIKRSPIDLLTVANELTNTGKLTEVGGPAYLTSLVNQVPSSLNAISYAQIVRGCAERRKGIAFANELATAAYDESKLFDLRQAAMKAVQSNGGQTRRVSTKEAASRAIDQMIQNPNFCITGISNVDNKIGGLFQDELEILAGYQGSGKSALKIQIMFKNADAKKHVLDCSLEMTAAQVWMRKACADLEIDLNQLRSGKVDSDTRGKVSRYAAELAEKYHKYITIYEAPMTPADILSATMLEKPDLVLIDHLRLITGKAAKDNRTEWYNDCIRFLRQEVAKGEHVNVMLLHQINRSAFKESRRPSMHDLAFAGEDDADGVYLLYRSPEEPINNLADMEMIVDKSRFGWTGTEKAKFHLTKQTFYNIDHTPRY